MSDRGSGDAEEFAGYEVGVGARLMLQVAPIVGVAWLRLVHATMRLNWHGAADALPADGGPVIYCFWHSQLVMMPWVQLRPPGVAPVSLSRDGEITARIFRYLKVEPVRGSSSRGARTLLRRLARAVRQGRDLGMTPDGPRGPVEVAQPGACWLAQITGRPLLPVAFACKPSIRLRSWDRLLVPVPFGKGVFVYDELLWVGGDRGAGDRLAAAAELSRRLRSAGQRARRLLLT